MLRAEAAERLRLRPRRQKVELELPRYAGAAAMLRGTNLILHGLRKVAEFRGPHVVASDAFDSDHGEADHTQPRAQVPTLGTR